jgi:hypothetical protein
VHDTVIRRGTIVDSAGKQAFAMDGDRITEVARPEHVRRGLNGSQSRMRPGRSGGCGEAARGRS